MAVKLQTLVENAERAAGILSLLANTKRLIILCHLIKQDRSVGELGQLVNLSHSAISQHLARLRCLDVVNSRKVGKEVFYSVTDPNIKEILNTLYRIYCK